MKTIQEIPLNQIDLSDETFSVNFRPDIQNLRSSIKELGLIQPVLLRKKNGGYQIVSGFRRIAVLNELKIYDIPSIIFGREEKEELKLFTITLHENMTTRGFNMVEKAIALNKLMDSFKVGSHSVIKTFLPLLHLEPNEKILNTYLSLAQMEDEVKEYVLREEVSRSNIRKIASLLPEDRRALIPFLSSLKLGENRLREILNLLNEIARRDRSRIREIVQHPQLQATLSRRELTPSQKTEKVKKILLELRYPRLTGLERTFEKKRKNLNFPPHISLFHPPFFEGKEWRIELRFETLEQYRHALLFLSQMAEEKTFVELIEGSVKQKP